MPQDQNQLIQKTAPDNYMPKHALNEPDAYEQLSPPFRSETAAELGGVAVTPTTGELPVTSAGEAATGPSPEAVRMLEDAGISPVDKADMLLVALGLRPATVLQLSEFYPLGGEPTKHNEDRAAQSIALAHRLGLSTTTDEYSRDFLDAFLADGGSPAKIPAVKEKIGKGERPQWAHVNVFVGKNEASSETLKAIWQAGEAADGGLAMGLALGYPATAAESFANKTTRYGLGMPDVRAHAFGGFALSSDSAKAEAEQAIALSWANAIQEASPKIHDQVMSARLG